MSLPVPGGQKIQPRMYLGYISGCIWCLYGDRAPALVGGHLLIDVDPRLEEICVDDAGSPASWW
jgi:hypothetical protein